MKKGRDRSILRTWMISYLAVLLLPLLFSGMVYQSAYSMIRRDAAERSQIALAQTNESIDRVFSELRSTGRQILSDDQVVSLMYARAPLTPADLQRISRLQAELARKSAFGSYIREIFVYFPSAGCAATTSGIMKQEYFEKVLRERCGVDYDTLGAAAGVINL